MLTDRDRIEVERVDDSVRDRYRHLMADDAAAELRRLHDENEMQRLEELAERYLAVK